MKMESHKQGTILYALGFLEEHIENTTGMLEVNEGTMTDEQMVKNSNENEYRVQVKAMWAVLETGYRQLLAENGRLHNRITMAELALRS